MLAIINATESKIFFILINMNILYLGFYILDFNYPKAKIRKKSD
jgi:hypothetical protein